MSKKSRVSLWWGKQNVTIKATIIAGIFTLVVAFFGCAGTLFTILANYFLTTDAIDSEKFILHLNNGFDSTTTPLLFTQINSEDFGVVPTQCIEVLHGNTPYQLDVKSVLEDAQEKSFAFDIITETPLVITNAILILENYTSPPEEDEIARISDINFFDPPGMGSVPLVFFPEKNINKATKQLTITRDDGSLRLDPGDAVTLIFPITFTDPGLYNIKFVVQGQLDIDRKAEFVSDIYPYAWVYVNDITRFPIKSFFGLAEMKWIGNCP